MKYSWERINLGEMAHNVASNPGGPRGDKNRSHDLSDDPANILMLCGNCHTIADSLPDMYREEVLTEWKRQHESRTSAAAKLTGGDVARPVVVFSTQIGGQRVVINEQAVVEALLQDNRIPVAPIHPIELETHGQPDDMPHYWAAQINTIRDQLRLLEPRLAPEYSDAPLAVFPLAEMTVLIAFGNALGDKSRVDLYQFARHQGKWTFQAPDADAPDFTVKWPTDIESDDLALIVDLTAAVDDDRVYAALGDESMPLIRFTTPSRSTELVQSRAVIEAFQREFRQCLTEIENRCSREVRLHLFPCLPAPLAVALGRCIMPKVSNPITIYDAKGVGGPFRPTVELPLPLTTENRLNEDEQSRGE
jgi:hypothetical protein